MNQPLRRSSAVFAMLFCITITRTANEFVIKKTTIPTDTGPRIQAAILLDVSGSMNGLIEQAKSQLWNMVNVLDKVKCENGNPKIEIALYEYGRDGNDPASGYVKQISGFTGDLNKLSLDLNSLTTNGGDEFCGQVIYASLNELNWDSSSSSYKVIFIAGNEDFLQGQVSYTKACAEAKKKGVIVNTIYCGDEDRGIREHWNLGAECGSGSFTNIDHNAKEKQIPTPYDSTLFSLNQQLNKTYITYGIAGEESLETLMQADTVAISDLKDMTKITGYVVTKSSKRLSNNAAWDLIDAAEKDSSFTDKVDMNTLPDSLKNKSREHLKQVVRAKTTERGAIRKQITEINTQRAVYIAAEKARTGITDIKILKTEIERIIKEQVKRFNMYIE
ncbi:MAG TPA: hypothetical protein VIZ28_01720 [Chitinophagaceae bacterium]